MLTSVRAANKMSGMSIISRDMSNDVVWESARAAGSSWSEYPTWQEYASKRQLTDRFRRPEQIDTIRSAFDRWRPAPVAAVTTSTSN